MNETAMKIETLKLTPTVWNEFPDVDDVKPIDDQDYVVLQEIKEVLLKHNAIDRFGINLIHRHFDIQDDEIIFESTDVESRSQKVEVRPLADIEGNSKVLETQWVFNGGKAVVCVSYCDYNNGHRNIHQWK